MSDDRESILRRIENAVGLLHMRDTAPDLEPAGFRPFRSDEIVKSIMLDAAKLLTTYES